MRNYADAGDTVSSLYPKFTSRGAALKKGDLFIQFGHNDMKSTADSANYKTNLMNFITHARSAMATAVSQLVADALKAGTTPPTSIADFLK